MSERGGVSDRADGSDPADGRGPKLTPDEDAALRRLHYFELTGNVLAPTVAEVKESIRARDRRDDIRLPADEVLVGDEPDQDLAPGPDASRPLLAAAGDPDED